MTRSTKILVAIAGVLWIAGVYVFLLAPLVVVIGASFGEVERQFISFPPRQLTLRWYREIPPELMHAALASLAIALTTAAISVALGVPAALGLVRSNVPGKKLLGALFRAPLQVPAVVVGVSFLQLYYRLDEWLGLNLISNFWGLAVAHAFMGTPYVVGPVVAVLQRMNVRLEEAAAILGASPWRSFRRVTLPLMMPGVYTGAMYAFMISFGDLPVALFLAGAQFKTFPVTIFQSMDYDFNPSLLAMSAIIVMISLVTMIAIQHAVGLGTLMRAGGGVR